MNILTFSEARAGLKAVMDDVCTDHSPTVITRQSGEAVVMLSLADFNSIEETLYLLSSPKNASRLLAWINDLIDACVANPFKGIGKPEPLKGNLTGLWSRRIDREHRLVYAVESDLIYIVACRYHY